MQLRVFLLGGAAYSPPRYDFTVDLTLQEIRNLLHIGPADWPVGSNIKYIEFILESNLIQLVVPFRPGSRLIQRDFNGPAFVPETDFIAWLRTITIMSPTPAMPGSSYPVAAAPAAISSPAHPFSISPLGDSAAKQPGFSSSPDAAASAAAAPLVLANLESIIQNAYKQWVEHYGMIEHHSRYPFLPQRRWNAFTTSLRHILTCASVAPHVCNYIKFVANRNDFQKITVPEVSLLFDPANLIKFIIAQSSLNREQLKNFFTATLTLKMNCLDRDSKKYKLLKMYFEFITDSCTDFVWSLWIKIRQSHSAAMNDFIAIARQEQASHAVVPPFPYSAPAAAAPAFPPSFPYSAPAAAAPAFPPSFPLSAPAAAAPAFPPSFPYSAPAPASASAAVRTSSPPRQALSEQRGPDTPGQRRAMDGNTCVVCMDERVGTVFFDCGHASCCRNCADRLKPNKSGQKLCPICQHPIRIAHHFYLSGV